MGGVVNGNGSLGPASHSNQRAADLLASNTDQVSADADQSQSDADQTASDQDEAAAERDEVDAENDQRAADSDQARAAIGGLPTDAWSSLVRQRSTVSRLASHRARAKTATARAGTSTERDTTADARDETARERDLGAEAIERSITASGAALAEQIEELRANAAASRSLAAADRARAAQDRADAARERARLEAELLSAHLDSLTGAFRREMGVLVLTLEIERARRNDGRFVVAFVDVDRLKAVNDRDGHPAGDRVLRTLVATLRAHLRSFDPIVRYGGDEFVCGLAGVDLVGVKQRLALVDRALRRAVGTGISVGLAALEAEETLDQVLARADADMLRVKKSHGSA